jgi:hypothetical protein
LTAAHVPGPWPGDLDWGSDWLTETATGLAHLGFELRDGGRMGTVPGPRLELALREHPTLEHFDPEEASYWVARDGHGRLATLDRRTAEPGSRPFSWGRIRISDRIPVSNEFLAFGGTLLVGSRDPSTVYAAFVSRAPIVRWAGHSQGVDPLTDEIGAFFARLMVPVDYQEGAEARIAEADPEALYAVFLGHALRRFRQCAPLRRENPSFARLVDHESPRLAHAAPVAWRAGQELLDWLELG